MNIEEVKQLITSEKHVINRLSRERDALFASCHPETRDVVNRILTHPTPDEADQINYYREASRRLILKEPETMHSMRIPRPISPVGIALALAATEGTLAGIMEILDSHESLFTALRRAEVGK